VDDRPSVLHQSLLLVTAGSALIGVSPLMTKGAGAFDSQLATLAAGGAHTVSVGAD
jgi:hypothetical protein